MEEDNLNIVNLVDDQKSKKYKGVIGTLRGIFADMNHPTRNGRQYTKACWEQALNSDDVKEKLETRTMFGELDHPPERLETLQERAAIITTKLEMNDKDGVIMGEADILDTPFGRILKTFIDAGVKVGISSRGAGEETTSPTGVNQIIPETFYLETFDIVSMPAVKSARLSLVESKNRNIITEAFAKEIKIAKSNEEVDELLNYAKSKNVFNITKLQEAANNVKNSFGENDILPEDEGDNIDVSSDVISQLEEELNVSNTKYKSLEGLCEKMKKHSIKTLKELNETKIVNEQLTKQVEDYIRKTDNDITMLESYKVSNKILKNKLNESKDKIDSLTKEINKKISESKLMKVKLERDNINESQMSQGKILSLKDENQSLSEQLQKAKSILAEKILKLENANKKLKEFEISNNKIKLENKDLTKELEKSKNEGLINKEKDQSSISDLNNQLEEAKKLIEDLQNKLSLKQKENSNLVKESKNIKESYLNRMALDNNINANELRKLLNENYSIKDVDNKVNMILENKKNIDRLSFNVGNSIFNESFISIKDESNEDDKETNSTINKMANKVKSFKS